MAFIDLLIGRNVQGEIDKLLVELNKVHQRVLDINQLGLNLNRGSGANSTADLQSLIDRFNQLTQAQQRASQQALDLAIREERLSQAQNRSSISTNQLERSNISLEQARERQARAHERELQRLQASQSAYNRTQQQINNLTRVYNDLAVRKARYNNLTEQEERRLGTLESTLARYNNTLRGVDASVGRHTRNVGNYASANNALSGSINQLTREAPAFANSAQTGFMAISNNLPIFFDAMSRTRSEIARLRAEGQQVPSLFSQLTSSIFSWGTALSVGVTLLTIYGKEIGNFFKSVIEGSKSINVLTESMKMINEARVKGTKEAQDEIVSMRANLEIAKDVNLSYKERNIAVDNLIKQYPFYFEGLTREQILAGQTAKAEKELTNALLSRAKAQAAMSKITENQGKIIDLEEKLRINREQVNIATKDILNTEKRLQSSNNVSNSQGIVLSQTYERRNRFIKEQKKLLSDKSILDEINNRLTSYAVENQKQSIGLDYKEEKSKEKVISKKREELELNKLNSKENDSLLEKLQEQKKLFEELQKEMSKNNNDWRRYQELIDATQDSIDLLTKGTNRYLEEGAKKTKEELNKLKKETKELAEVNSQYLKSFVDSFAGASGLPTVFKILRKEIKGFGEDAATTVLAVSEAFQEMYNLLTSGSEEYFQNELKRNEEQKKIAVEFAGDSATAKEEIERQYEEKRKAIQKRQAEAEKEKAIFNAVINTAQAVVAALPNIPLSIAIGIIGAAQIAAISSRPIPEFWKGTESAPEGIAKTQEKGREFIFDKNYNLKSTGSDKGTRFEYLSAGDKVWTAERTRKFIDENKFQGSLNRLLLDNTINPIVFTQNQNNNDNGVINAINGLRSDLLNNNSSLIITRDRRGERVFEQKNGMRRELLNNSLKGVAKYVK